MKKFFLRILALSVPFDILLIVYVVCDPFKAIWHYDRYYSPDDFLEINRGYEATCMYDNNNETYHYDSFLFGNSRSLAYLVKDWKQYIPATSSCFHFDCSRGSVEDVYYKIKYINAHGDTLRNVIFTVDYDVLSNTSQTGHLYDLPPQVNHNLNYVSFQVDHMKAFFYIKFLRAYIEYSITHKFNEHMCDFIVKYNNEVDTVTNEINRIQESLIDAGEYYTDDYVKIFRNAQFPDSISPVAINDERKEMLKEISDMLAANKTNYKIVVNPLYNQIRLNPEDVKFLKQTFGAANVFDFSGPNKWNADFHNYYEKSHYRPNVANELMSIMYARELSESRGLTP